MKNLIYFLSLLFLTLFNSIISAGPIEGGGGPHTMYLTKAHGLKKEMPTKQLNLVLQNHLIKAEVERHPSQKIKLFDACINNDRIVSISNSPRSYCKRWGEQKIVTSEGSYKELWCKSWSSPKLKHGIKYAKKNPKNCQLIKGEDHPNQSLYGKYKDKLVPYCEYSRSAQDVAKTQFVRVYRMNEYTSGNVYFRPIEEDKAQPGYFQYKYTLPNCSR